MQSRHCSIPPELKESQLLSPGAKCLGDRSQNLVVSKKVQLHVFNKFPEFTQKSKQASNLQDLESLQPESCSMSWEMTRPFSQEQQMVKEGAPYKPQNKGRCWVWH